MEVRATEVEVVEKEKMKKEKVKVSQICWLQIRCGDKHGEAADMEGQWTWMGGGHGWGGGMKFLEVKVEAGQVGGEGGVVGEFSDIFFRVQ